jgi:hypothetical protein
MLTTTKEIEEQYPIKVVLETTTGRYFLPVNRNVSKEQYEGVYKETSGSYDLTNLNEAAAKVLKGQLIHLEKGFAKLLTLEEHFQQAENAKYFEKTMQAVKEDVLYGDDNGMQKERKTLEKMVGHTLKLHGKQSFSLVHNPYSYTKSMQSVREIVKEVSDAYYLN